MIIKTKKYQLPVKTYRRQGLKGIWRQQWWVILIPVLISAGYLLAPSLWWFIGAWVAYGLYWLFWYIQFVGIPQMEQSRFLFEKLAYEITSQQILLKIDSKRGMPVKWEQIKRAKVSDEAFTLYMSKAQFFYWPHSLFKTKHEISFIQTVLKRKGLIAE